MTTRPRRHHDRKPGPAGSLRHATQQVPPDDDSTAAADHSGQDPRSGRLACSVNEAARLTGLSRDLLYDKMRRGDLASVKVGRGRLITRQHLQQFPGIAS
jgi:excisionase family DNA binding protein